MAKKHRARGQSLRSGALSATKAWDKKMQNGVGGAGRDAGFCGETGAEEPSSCAAGYVGYR